MSPSLSMGTSHGCTPADATAKTCLSANFFKTGSWEDRPWVCTALASSLGSAGGSLGAQGVPWTSTEQGPPGS